MRVSWVWRMWHTAVCVVSAGGRPSAASPPEQRGPYHCRWRPLGCVPDEINVLRIFARHFDLWLLTWHWWEWPFQDWDHDFLGYFECLMDVGFSLFLRWVTGSSHLYPPSDVNQLIVCCLIHETSLSFENPWYFLRSFFVLSGRGWIDFYILGHLRRLPVCLSAGITGAGRVLVTCRFKS